MNEVAQRYKELEIPDRVKLSNIDSLQSRETSKIDTSNLEKIAKLYPEMESALSDYTVGLINEQQLIDELKNHYDIDLQNYGNYLLAKNQDNLEFVNTVGLNSAEVVNQFLVDYGIDIGNHTTYAQKKIAIEQQTLETISNIWAKYYNAQSRSLTEAGQTLEDAVLSGAAVNDPNAIELYNNLHKQSKIYEDAVDALNDITNWQPKNSLTNTTIDEMAKKLTALQANIINDFNSLTSLMGKYSDYLSNLLTLQDSLANQFLIWIIETSLTNRRISIIGYKINTLY